MAYETSQNAASFNFSAIPAQNACYIQLRFSAFSKHTFHCHPSIHSWLIVYTNWNVLCHFTLEIILKILSGPDLNTFYIMAVIWLPHPLPTSALNTTYKVYWFTHVHIPLYNSYTVLLKSFGCISYIPLPDYPHVLIQDWEYFKSMNSRGLEKLQCVTGERK